MKKILVLNAGSSSIKYQLFEMPQATVLILGLVERIGESSGRIKYKYGDNESSTTMPILNHTDGLNLILDMLLKLGVINNLNEIAGIGHRVVHGGEAFFKPTIITDEVLKAVHQMTPLAPLHNPANLMGIEISKKLCPKALQVAIFDTAFHQTLAPAAFHYAIPQYFYQEFQVRRYGFHGTSHFYVSKQAAEFLKRPYKSSNLITAHLGNGCSISAIKNGECIDTSMGMTPLEGLVMGTRSGDLDPAIPFYLARMTGKSFDEIEKILNKESGLKGICGANDMREVEGFALAGKIEANLAVEMFCRRIKKYIGAYTALLGRVDALVFTGGIGENSSNIRKICCDQLDHLGIALEQEKNNHHLANLRDISDQKMPVRVLVVPTNEELEIAQQTFECMKLA